MSIDYKEIYLRTRIENVILSRKVDELTMMVEYGQHLVGSLGKKKNKECMLEKQLRSTHEEINRLKDYIQEISVENSILHYKIWKHNNSDLLSRMRRIEGFSKKNQL